MGQVYLERFEYWSAVSKFEFDRTWDAALEAFAGSGNWGGVKRGVRHLHTYGTAWGGYALIEVEDAEAFTSYQLHHYENYSHVARITFEPLADLDAHFAPRIAEIRAKATGSTT